MINDDYLSALKYVQVKTANKDCWVDYDNGNYHVWINKIDGTKIRLSKDDEFIASRPESMDIKITNACSMGCKYCHEDSRIDGKHADITQPFIDTLKPYTEIAVGGGNVLEHPELETFLKKLKNKQCIASITVNQKHFIENYEYIMKLYKDGLVYGIGVSLTDANDENFIILAKKFPTLVVHTILGIVTEKDLRTLANNSLKVLFLGYKDVRRGISYRSSHDENIKVNTEWVAKNISDIRSWFKVISFDNLSLKQLNLQDTISPEEWETFYMGDDGHHTFYIDMVEQEYAKSSTSMDRFSIGNKSVVEMFEHIVSEAR